MSHNAWAAFSAIELARDCQDTPANWFASTPPWRYQTYATRDSSAAWPQPDGAVEIAQIPGGASHLIAIEFKRTNEGIHGVLTGLGQVQAYIRKGFGGSILVLPAEYDNLDKPGLYVSSVLAQTAPDAPIGVFSYETPDINAVSPFVGRLRCDRALRLDPLLSPAIRGQAGSAGRQHTQWAHVREGSTVPDTLYRYLRLTYDAAAVPVTGYEPQISAELRNAVWRIDSGADPVYFLSSTSPTRARRSFADQAWRRFWFEFVLTPQVQRIWRDEGGNLVLDGAPTGLKRWDGQSVVFFARAGSSKALIFEDLLAKRITADRAWERYAKNIRGRAHQFREDVDSGAEAAGFIDADGRLTDLGFRFVTVCDRAQSANSPGPLAILRWALLTNGGFLALLHYIHSISDKVFRDDQFRFVRWLEGNRMQGRAQFQSVDYRNFLLTELSETLRVAGRSAQRGGRARPALEGEFITMRKLGLVGNFRLGLGLEINWPAVHDALEAVSL